MMEWERGQRVSIYNFFIHNQTSAIHNYYINTVVILSSQPIMFKIIYNLFQLDPEIWTPIRKSGLRSGNLDSDRHVDLDLTKIKCFFSIYHIKMWFLDDFGKSFICIIFSGPGSRWSKNCTIFDFSLLIDIFIHLFIYSGCLDECAERSDKSKRKIMIIIK